DVRTDILARSPDGNRQEAHVRIVPFKDDIMNHTLANDDRSHRRAKRRHNSRIDVVGSYADRASIVMPAGAKDPECKRDSASLDILEEESEALVIWDALEHPLCEARRFPGWVHLPSYTTERAGIDESRHQGSEIWSDHVRYSPTERANK